MKRVLIVGADFTPSSHPPALRIRFFAQHLREFGWEPVVLTTDPAHYETEIDSENERLLPPDLEVVRTSALPRELARKLGFGDVALRSLWHHWRALVRICRERPVDLILVPIPPNWTMLLGRFAYIRLGIPYVIDYSDPVGSDYYWQLPRSQRPPKYALVYSLVRKIERFAIKRAAHIVAVSRGIAEGLAAPDTAVAIDRSWRPAHQDRRPPARLPTPARSRRVRRSSLEVGCGGISLCHTFAIGGQRRHQD